MSQDHRSRRAHARSRLEADAKAAVLEVVGELVTNGQLEQAKVLANSAGRVADMVMRGIGRNWRFVSRSRQQITLET